MELPQTDNVTLTKSKGTYIRDHKRGDVFDIAPQPFPIINISCYCKISDDAYLTFFMYPNDVAFIRIYLCCDTFWYRIIHNKLIVLGQWRRWF